MKQIKKIFRNDKFRGATIAFSYAGIFAFAVGYFMENAVGGVIAQVGLVIAFASYLLYFFCKVYR